MGENVRCARRDIKSNIKYPVGEINFSVDTFEDEEEITLRYLREILSFVPISAVSSYFIRVVNYIHIAGSFWDYPAIRR